MTKQPIVFTFSSIDSVNDLADTLEMVMRPFLEGAEEYGGYESDDDADKVFDHAQEWLTILRDFVRNHAVVEC